MRKSIFTLLIIAASSIAAWAQLDYARYYYKITVADGSNVVWDHTTNNGNIKFNSTFHAGKNQQWTVMPLYIMRKGGVLETHPSNEFVITTRYNGKVLDVVGSSDAYVYWPFHGGVNQMFKLDPTGALNTFTISSPLNVNRVLQRVSPNPTNELWFFPVSSPVTGMQKNIVTKYAQFPYYFSTLADKNMNAIPFPAAPTSFTQVMPTETAKVFIEEVLIPYPLIKNDLAYGLQVESSPYYKLVHKQYYRRAAGNWDVVFLKNGTYTQTIQVKTGTVQSQVDEVTSKLDVSFSSTGEATFKILGVGAKLANTLGAAFSKSVKQVSSWTETYEKTETYTSSVTTLSLDRRVVTYQLVDAYELYRANNQTTPSIRWEVGRNESVQRIFEGESSGGRVASPEVAAVEYMLIDGKMIPKSKTKNAPERESIEIGQNPTFNVEPGKFMVFPNPSRGNYTIQLPRDRYSSVLIVVYDSHGTIVHQEQKRNLVENLSDVLLPTLPRGNYILKVVADEDVNTQRITIE